MENAIVPKTLLWFLLFPINRYAVVMFRKLYNIVNFHSANLAEFANYQDTQGTKLLLAESTLAFIVFVISVTWYSIFAYGTINQICTNLDIYCFTIKQMKEETLKKKNK